MATKAKGAPANFDAAGHVSKNVHGGVRILTGKTAAMHKRLAGAALDKTKKKLLAPA